MNRLPDGEPKLGDFLLVLLVATFQPLTAPFLDKIIKPDRPFRWSVPGIDRDWVVGSKQLGQKKSHCAATE